MEFRIAGAADPYFLQRPEQLQTPRLLVFRDRVEYNIRRIVQLLQHVSSDLDAGRLWPHVKTTKSSWAVQLLKQRGISHFKCTMNEVDMLVRCGVEKIFVAYPLLDFDARKIAHLAASHPVIQFYVQIGHKKHVEILEPIARETGLKWRCFIDVNVGMDRTGLPVEEAFDFYRAIAVNDSFIFSGLHAYDGHVHQVSEKERRASAAESMTRLQKSCKQFAANSVAIPITIVSGTPGFLMDAAILRDAPLPSRTFYSPGTWVYFDTQSREMLPDTFELAALILAQIIDKPTPDTATLNLGHKRWAVDQGAVEAFSVAGMTAASWSEEHTVVNVPDNVNLEIGDYVLVAPRHVCPTVNLWEHFVVVNKVGNIENESVPVDARNR